MRNPFTLGIAQKNDFCNRKKEITDLLQHAKNGDNTVLFSPRRYGKSSLIARIIEQLREEGYLTVYVDLYPITSEQDFISRFSNGIFKGIGRGADTVLLRTGSKTSSADLFRVLRLGRGV